MYYSTFPIREQAQRGSERQYELKAVYTVAILDFIFDEDKANREKYRYDVKLIDIETCRIFYDKLTFVYLEMPKFQKPITELATRFDEWMYVIRNLNKLDRIPNEPREEIFEKLFELAEIARFIPEEVQAYEDSLKAYRDLKNALETAREEERGQTTIDIVKKSFAAGLSVAMIAQITGLSEEEVTAIKAQR